MDTSLVDPSHCGDETHKQQQINDCWIWFFLKPNEEEVPWFWFIDTLKSMILHFLLAVVAGTAQASSYYNQPFSQFVHETTAIVRGTLGNIHTENAIAPDGAKIIYTYATVEVIEVLKGAINPQSTVIRELGGTKDGYTLTIPELRS